jgi:hypothetical protein
MLPSVTITTSIVLDQRTKYRDQLYSICTSDETTKYGYWSFNDLTSECRHCKLQTRPLVREGAQQGEH